MTTGGAGSDEVRWALSWQASSEAQAAPIVGSWEFGQPPPAEFLAPGLPLPMRPPAVASLSWPRIEVSVLSLRLGSAPPRVHSYEFVEPVDRWQTKTDPPPPRAEMLAVAGSQPPPLAPARGKLFTRLRPPSDTVKVVDRLYYLLQPPLEAWLSGAAIDLPAAPFSYQLEGVAFLYPRVAAVLADEMGLGKTMQTILAIRLLLRSGELARVLLVCPKPLVSNWQREFRFWAPEIPLAVVEGDQARRRWQWQSAEVPVTLANYEIVQRDRDWVGGGQRPYDLVVLDESQRIKNRSGTTSEAVRSIRRRRSWALTGTPVENSVEDLIGIFEFIAPGYLHGQTKVRRLAKLAGEYVLRRTKDQVLTELPPRLTRDARLDLSAAQRETYRLAEEEGVLRLAGMGQAATIQHVFELVLRLKQICNFDPATGESAKAERLAADLEEIAASGRKAIVFSQWVATLEELAERLSALAPLAYHGQVPQRQREAVLRTFQTDPCRPVLLMSYGAGGVGLNLQFAQYVFLFDRWWNPAVEDQAICRAHRLGAAGPVTVTRFLTPQTIEERIDQVLSDKRELFESLFSQTEAPAHLGLSREEIFGLFRLAVPAGTNSRAS